MPSWQASDLPSWVQITTGASGNLNFQLPVTSILNSLVTLTLNADTVALVQNVSPGKIISAQACLTESFILSTASSVS